jgi:hypothetical protein
VGRRILDRGVLQQRSSVATLASPWWVVLAATVMAFGDSAGLGFRLVLCQLGASSRHAPLLAAVSGQASPALSPNDPCAGVVDEADAVLPAGTPAKSQLQVRAAFDVRRIDWQLPSLADLSEAGKRGSPVLELALVIPDSLGVHLAVVAFEARGAVLGMGPGRLAP